MNLKKYLLKITFVLLLVSTTSFAQRTLYIDNTFTNTANDGLTEATAFPNFFRAANMVGGLQPGDVVLVKEGPIPYNNATSGNPVLNLMASGTAAAPITFKNFPGHNPVIQLGVNNWQGIYIKGDYIVIDGLTVRGLNASQTLTDALAQPGGCQDPLVGSPPARRAITARFNANGIQVDGRLDANNNPTGRKYHHITIKNCTVYECGGSGIQILQADYITIDNNKCYNNAWYSVFAPSGISVYQSFRFDETTGYKIIVTNNTCYGNSMNVPWVGNSCRFTDGNGIIIDDSKHTQAGSTLGPYLGRTLVANNIVYNNGGSGIHSFSSEYVDIINNTAYQNQASDQKNSDGEIYFQNSNDVRIFNNILSVRSNKRVNSNFTGNGTTNSYGYNLHFGGNGLVALTGTGTIVGDPRFTSPTTGDFTLQSTSPAINAGIGTFATSNAPTTDILNRLRPSGTGFDLGAYEFGASLSFDSKAEKTVFLMYPNPATSFVNLNVEANNGEKIQVNVLSMLGQIVYSKTFTAYEQGQNILSIDPSIRPGVYGVSVSIGKAQTTKLLFIE